MGFPFGLVNSPCLFQHFLTLLIGLISYDSVNDLCANESSKQAIHTAVENINLEVSSSKLVAFPSGLVGRPSLVQPRGNTNESDL